MPILNVWGPADSGAIEAIERKGPLSPIASSRAHSRRVPEPVSKRRSVKETLELIHDRLADIKAEDTVTIDLAGKTSIADALVITSGRSNRHVAACADRVTEGLKAAGVADVRVEGMPHCDWVVIDVGDVIVHIFRPEVRAFYNLEKMWAGGMRTRRAG
jgi:ribosome-associated protein